MFSLTRPTKLREDLRAALKSQQWSKAEALLEQGAQVQPQNFHDTLELWLAANKGLTGTRPENKWAGWNWLLEHGAVLSPELGQALLNESMKQGPLGRLDWLLQHGVVLPPEGSKAADSLVNLSVWRSSVKGMEWLAAHGRSVDPITDPHRSSSLLMAVEAHKTKAMGHVKTLARLGATIRASGPWDHTPLQQLATQFRELCKQAHQGYANANSWTIPARQAEDLLSLWRELERLGDQRHAPDSRGQGSAWEKLEQAAGFHQAGPEAAHLLGALQAEERQQHAQQTSPAETKRRRLRS